jgi:DNA-directed RNA polymerase subunit RPC12/RpoP
MKKILDYIPHRARGDRCPYCSNKRAYIDNCLKTINPELAKQWHPDKNKSLTPYDVLPNSGKKVWWLCVKGHEWQQTIMHRNKGAGCPYCSGRYPTKENNLAVINPVIAKQWHPDKNGTLTPKDVVPGTSKKAWWKCSKNHEWEASISSRNSGVGCPYCSGKKVCLDNCLQTINPELAKQWHPTKNNSLKPSNQI